MNLFGRRRTYLDWAASAPVHKSVMRVFKRTASLYGNPSSPHKDGVLAKEALEEARTVIARLAEVKPAGVVFTSGATEANNLVITGTVTRVKKSGKSVHVLYLPSCHASVIRTLEFLQEWGVETEPLKVRDGAIDLATLKKQLRPDTCLVVIDAVCGETGTKWDARGVRNMLEEYGNVYGSRPHLHVDASQTPLSELFSLTHLRADSLSLDAQKVGGVRGVGALCMRAPVALEPVLHGGGQEGGLRPGTEPVALICAFAEALKIADKNREVFKKRSVDMRASVISLVTSAFSNVEVNVGKQGVPHILNFSFSGLDTDYLVMLLDKEGFSVATKSACETDSESGSRAVLLLTEDSERAATTLRISWGPTTSATSLGRFVQALVRSVLFLRSH